MIKNLIKITLVVVAAFAITGCANRVDGMIVPGSKYIEQNSSTKLYFEDTNNAVIKEDLTNLVNFLNESKISPEMQIVSKSTSESDNIDDFDSELVKNNGKTIDLKFSVDSNSNYIVVNKKYTSRNEAYLDIKQVWQFIKEQTTANTDLRDKFGSNGEFYFVEEKALNDGKLMFTTKREIARHIFAEKTYKAFAYSGYQMVNSPKDADKIVYFQFTRDYRKAEIDALNKQGKDINLGVLNRGSNQVNLMQSTMNIASKSNSSGASVGIGLGAGLVAGILFADRNPNLVIPTFKITEVKEKKDYLLTIAPLTYLYKNFYHSEFDKNRLYFKADERSAYENNLKGHNEGREYFKGTLLN